MGDRKAVRDAEFQSFVTSRWPRLLRTAFLLTGEQHAAEDLTQTTLEQAYAAWRRVGAADDPEAYVRRVMINAHARRHRRRLRECLAPKDDTGLAREVPDTGDRIAQADDRGALLAALAQLPPRQREAVVLRYWEDRSVEETSRALHLSAAAVTNRSLRALAALRTELADVRAPILSPKGSR